MGLLTLCDVALGKTIEYTEADEDADEAVRKGDGHSTVGVGKTAPGEIKTLPDGIQVPCGQCTTREDLESSLLYNEYIVYDPRQIQLRYNQVSGHF